MTSDPLFAILGPVEVHRPGAAPLALGGRKARQLLTLLVMHRNRAVSADRLAESLWGDGRSKGAEVTLRSHISHLRRRLAGAALHETLVTGPAGYTLVLAAGQVDADRFEELVGLGQEALGLGHAKRAVELIREALGWWRGMPYADLEDVEEAAVEQARLQELHLVALETLATARLAAGQHGEVVGELQGLVAAHPFRERFCVQLMVALYRSGRQADALAAYTATRDRLSEDLGLDPGPELQELAQAVLRQDPVLLGDATPPPAPPPSSSGRPMPQLTDAVLAAASRTLLVGRAAEMERVEAAWRAVRAGGRSLLLVSGEAGIGKTRVVAGLAHRLAEEGQAVLVGRCETAGAPYHPVAGALRSSGQVTEALAEAPEPVARDVAMLVDGPDGAPRAHGVAPYEDERRSLYTSVEWVLGRLVLAGPVLLVIEDADRIDRASSLLLRHLTDRAPAGLLVIISYRDPPGGRHPPLLEVLGAVTTGDLVQRLVVGPLREGEVAELVRAVAPDATPDAIRLVWHQSDGNPYYATELARALSDPGHGGPDRAEPRGVPSSVRDALRLRLASLSETARVVLRGAAVLGSEFEVEPLAGMVHVDEDGLAEALEEAVDAGLLVESGRSWVGSYAFPHALTREAIRGDLTGPRLRRLHAQAARALMSRYRVGSGIGPEVAAHLQAAGSAADPNEAAEWSLRAARESSAVHAWDEAIEHADAAVDLLQGRATEARLAEAAVYAANLRLRSSRGFGDAIALLELALRQFLAAGNESSAGTVHSRIGGALALHHSVMDIPRALEHFEAAERLLGEAASAFHVTRGRSQAAMFGIRTDVLGAAADRSAAIAAETGRRDLAAFAAWAQAWAAFNQGRLANAAEAFERSWATAHELSDAYLGWMPANAAALVANAYLLDPAEGRRWCRRGLGQPRFTSLAHSHDTVVDQLALALAAAGDLASARELVSSLRPDALAYRMMMFLDGDWEGARDAWASAVTADEAAGDLHDAALNSGWLGTVRLTLGDRHGARAAWERALELGRCGPQVPTELAAGAELARLWVADDVRVAAGHLQRCDDILAAGEDWRGVAGRVELARAEVAGARDDHELADAHYARAIEVFSTVGLPWHRAEAELSAARSLASRDRFEEADERRRQADQVYREIGASDRWQQSSSSP